MAVKNVSTSTKQSAPKATPATDLSETLGHALACARIEERVYTRAGFVRTDLLASGCYKRYSAVDPEQHADEIRQKRDLLKLAIDRLSDEDLFAIEKAVVCLVAVPATREFEERRMDQRAAESRRLGIRLKAGAATRRARARQTLRNRKPARQEV